MRIAILGCGYVGLALGRRLVDDHHVVGVRRSRDGLERVAAAGLEAVEADVTDAASLEAVPNVDAVVFAASAGGRRSEDARRTYVEGLRTVTEHFGSRESTPDRLVYTSSTGVYGDHDGAWVDETTPPARETDRQRALAAAEDVVLEATAFEGTIARLGGIYGPDRYRIERYLEGSVTEGWVNLVHRADAAGVVAFLLANDLARGEVVNAVDDRPVEKSELAGWIAKQCGVDPPEVKTVEERISDGDLPASAERRLRTNKRVSNEKLRDLGYEFSYPTYREGYREAIAEYRGGE